MEERAQDDLAGRFRYLERTATPQAADAWLDEILDALESLAILPERCPIAPESDLFPVAIRQLLVGSVRILFTVSPETRTVHVLHIRHQAQRLGPG